MRRPCIAVLRPVCIFSAVNIGALEAQACIYGYHLTTTTTVIYWGMTKSFTYRRSYIGLKTGNFSSRVDMNFFICMRWWSDGFTCYIA